LLIDANEDECSGSMRIKSFMYEHKSVFLHHRYERSTYGNVSIVYKLTIDFNIVLHNLKYDHALKVEYMIVNISYCRMHYVGCESLVAEEEALEL